MRIYTHARTQNEDEREFVRLVDNAGSPAETGQFLLSKATPTHILLHKIMGAPFFNRTNYKTIVWFCDAPIIDIS